MRKQRTTLKLAEIIGKSVASECFDLFVMTPGNAGPNFNRYNFDWLLARVDSAYWMSNRTSKTLPFAKKAFIETWNEFNRLYDDDNMYAIMTAIREHRIVNSKLD